MKRLYDKKEAKILIVDDSRTYRGIFSSYLEVMGFKFISAANGNQALTLFLNEWPDLILLDVNMPDMNGFEVARKIRDLGEEWAHWVPIIFLSSHARDEDVIQAVDVGGDDYLSKPVRFAVLQAKIKAMLRIASQRMDGVEVARSLARANEQLEWLSHSDGLTGIPNKRYFNDYLDQEWHRCMRHQLPISLLFIDVDYFKPYNDCYGHLQGDMCLKKVAVALSETLSRYADMVFRYGGEEFVIILPGTDINGMYYMGKLMVQVIRDLQLPHAHSDAGDVVSISVGGETLVPQQGDDTHQLLKMADAAVYQAKNEGRNRFVASQHHFVPHYLWLNGIEEKAN